MFQVFLEIGVSISVVWVARNLRDQILKEINVDDSDGIQNTVACVAVGCALVSLQLNIRTRVILVAAGTTARTVACEGVCHGSLQPQSQEFGLCRSFFLDLIDLSISGNKSSSSGRCGTEGHARESRVNAVESSSSHFLGVGV